MAEPTTPPPAAAPKKSQGKLTIIITIVGLLFLGGGGAAAFYVLRKPAGAEIAPKPKPKPAAAGGVVTFEPFVVNLADAGAPRFLRVSVRLIVDEAEHAERIQKSEVTTTRLRSSILELLTEQTSDRLVTAEGKAALKKAIAEKAHAVLEPVEVSDVLFSDFVVQF